MSNFRFLNFNLVDRVGTSSKGSPESEKEFMPGKGHLPHDPTGALPEEEGYTGPKNDLSGGDAGRSPGHMVKDVSDLDKGTGTVGPSSFKSQENFILRSKPRGQ